MSAPHRSPLLSHVRVALEDAAVADDAVRLVKNRLTSSNACTKRAHTRMHSTRFALAFGVLILAAAVVVFLLARPATPTMAAIELAATGEGTRVPAVGEILHAGESLPLQFSDGTQIELAKGASLAIIALDARGGTLRLDRGSLRGSFRHFDDTRWIIQAGPVGVEVTGTRFDVAWEPVSASFEITMEAGSVGLHGCGLDDRRAVAGDVVRTMCKDGGTANVVPNDVVVPSRDVRDLPSSPFPPQNAPAPSTKTSPMAAADERASLRDLVATADAARARGDATVARTALLEIRQRFPGAAAIRAAFDLGVLAMDVNHDFAEAARWLRVNLDEDARGPLRREALGRLLEALDALHDSGAARVATTYLAEFPQGPHASHARRLTSSVSTP